MAADEAGCPIPQTVIPRIHRPVFEMAAEILAESFHRAVSAHRLAVKRGQQDAVEGPLQPLPQPVGAAFAHLAHPFRRETLPRPGYHPPPPPPLPPRHHPT